MTVPETPNPTTDPEIEIARLVEASRVSLETKDRAERRVGMFKSALVALSVLLVIVGGGMLLVLQLQSRDTAINVESCVVPGGACYERGQQRLQETEETHEDVLRVLELLCEDRPDARACND